MPPLAAIRPGFQPTLAPARPRISRPPSDPASSLPPRSSVVTAALVSWQCPTPTRASTFSGPITIYDPHFTTVRQQFVGESLFASVPRSLLATACRVAPACKVISPTNCQPAHGVSDQDLSPAVTFRSHLVRHWGRVVHDQDRGIQQDGRRIIFHICCFRFSCWWSC